MAGSININGSFTGLPSGTVGVGPYTIPATTLGKVEVLSVNLASGTNTIAVPPWAGGVYIIPDPTNVIEMVVKGVAGDFGLPISITQPFLWCFFAAPAPNFVVFTSGSSALYTTFTFF